MKNTYSINMRRLLLLIRNSIIINQNLVLIIAAVFTALIILGRVANALSGDSPYSYGNMFFLLLYISGFALTISINRELHDKRKSNTFLLLPASTLEKFITLLFLPTLLLVVGLIIYMTIMSLIIEFGVAAFFNTDINAFNPFSITILKRIVIYIGIQSPFLLGSIYFKKHAMSFTFLFLFILYGIIFWGFTLLIGKYFLGEYLPLILPDFRFIDGVMEFGEIDTLYAMTLMDRLNIALGFWEPVVRIYYQFIGPLLWWIVAFFSLKEMEQ